MLLVLTLRDPIPKNKKDLGSALYYLLFGCRLVRGRRKPKKINVFSFWFSTSRLDRPKEWPNNLNQSELSIDLGLRTDVAVMVVVIKDLQGPSLNSGSVASIYSCLR